MENDQTRPATVGDVNSTRAELTDRITEVTVTLRAEIASTEERTRGYIDQRIAETRRQIAEEGERTRRHFDGVAESIHETVRVIAEAVGWNTTRLQSHEQRISRLEQQ